MGSDITTIAIDANDVGAQAHWAVSSKQVETYQTSKPAIASHRQLAEEFKIGRTQVRGILKPKAEIMDAFEDNAN